MVIMNKKIEIIASAHAATYSWHPEVPLPRCTARGYGAPPEHPWRALRLMTARKTIRTKKMKSTTMLAMAKKEMPAVQQVITTQVMVYSIERMPTAREAMFRHPNCVAVNYGGS